MKNYFIQKVLLLSLITCFLSCNTDFIEEKEDYSAVNIGIYQEEELANRYLNFLYYLFLPSDNENMAMWTLPAEEHNGNGSLFAQSSDEAAGQTDLNQVWAQISPANNHCLRSIGSPITTNTGTDAWSRIRYINLYLTNVDNYSGLSEEFKNQVKGQFYFWRAWQYFELVRLYGGVPIILDDQAPTPENPNNQTPRNTSGEVINQIVEDLETSQNLLENAQPYTADDLGKVTAAAAAALKGRVLLTWASPLFNRNDEVARWQRAYDANLAAYITCTAAGKGLNPDWEGMWFEDGNIESIFSFGFNNNSMTGNLAKNNFTEQASRSEDQGGAGDISPTKSIVDAFPMSDGTPYNPGSNLNDFYKNRDPRFYWTFAINGSEWPFAEEPNFVNWTYTWQTIEGGLPERSTELNPNNSGLYLRKFTDPNSSQDNFVFSGADYMEIRFAEVVLNLAEAAVGIGNLQEAKDYIQDIRARANVENSDGQYGLVNVNTRDQHFQAIINERKVEFAYENKRFYDLRRWLLFNDEYGTCSRLNQIPIEGTRRQGFFIIATNEDGSEYVGNIDPFDGETAPLMNRDLMTEEDIDRYFKVVVRDNLDPNVDNWRFKWYNAYYFFGIYNDVIETAPYLQQTQGWGGSFNPL